LASNEFHDTVYTCGPEDFLVQGNVEICPITNGNQVLETLGFTYPVDYWVGIVVIFGLFVFFRVLAYIFLLIQTARALKHNQ